MYIYIYIYIHTYVYAVLRMLFQPCLFCFACLTRPWRPCLDLVQTKFNTYICMYVYIYVYNAYIYIYI